jgi:DNA-binding transcriptional regulator YiaG/DNA-directed RNA polymerase specialized sigma24 family protein
MKLDIEAIKKRNPAAMADFLYVVKKSARIGCRKVGAESIEDDVVQEVAMLFLSRLIDKFDREYNAEPILIETSRRVALSLIRKNREMLVEDTNELIESQNNVINLRDDFDFYPVSTLDQQKALQALNMERLSREVVISNDRPPTDNPDYPIVDPASIVRKRGKSNKVLSKSCARIREIRTSLELSQEAFSSQLGIPTATLLSYEYGRTPNVPSHIMEKAEEIFERENSVAKRIKSQAERPMSEIIKEWAQMLQIDENDFRTIAEIVGVAKSTIHRWNDGEMRPRPRELNAYIRAVKIVAKRIKSGRKAISEIY